MIILDLHGFRHEMPLMENHHGFVLRAFPTIAREMYGIGQLDTSTVNSLRTVQFRWAYDNIYVCDGCPICNPYFLDETLDKIAQKVQRITKEDIIASLVDAVKEQLRPKEYGY